MDDHVAQNIPEIMYNGNLWWKLAEIPEDTIKRFAEKWTKPLFTISKTGSNYRFINYLSETGLLPDTRKINGVGWRKLAFVELVYINITILLRDFGVKAPVIKKVYSILCDGIGKEPQTAPLNNWLDVLLLVQCGCEIELFVKRDGNIFLSDPNYSNLFGRDATDGLLRISLSVPVNKSLASIGMPEVRMNNSFSYSGLSSAEVETVKTIRNMEPSVGSLKIRKTKGGVLLDKEQLETNSEFLIKISNLVKEYDQNFMSVNVTKRDGRVVNVKQTETLKFEDYID